MTEAPPIRIRELLATLRKYYLVILIPTIGLACAAAMYGVTKTKTWRATQTLTIREEAAGDTKGRFLDSESMQNAQETVLEVARSTQVVAEALKQVGPDEGQTNTANWPSRQAIEDLQSRIAVSAPKGKEFGKTEIIYLSVKAPSAEKAVTLTAAVGDQLVERLKQIRLARAQSVIDELLKSRDLANTDLHGATEALTAIETKIGSDLSELRTLNQSSAGTGNLTSTQLQIRTDLRASRNRELAATEVRKHLKAALSNPDHLNIGAPKTLLNSYPQLQRLSVGLADAQLAKSQLRGKMTDAHPKVKAATHAEQRVRDELRRELGTVLRGLESEIATEHKMSATYEKQLGAIDARLATLASVRTTYQQQEKQVEQRTQIVEHIENDLATARSSLVAANTASLLHRMSEPAADDNPVGPGTMAITAVGVFGGLLAGTGLVFLIAPFGARRGRRATDKVGGRRESDRATGRRGEDESATPPSPADVSDGRRTNDRSLETEAAPVQKDEQPEAIRAIDAAMEEIEDDLILTSNVEIAQQQPGPPMSLAASLSKLSTGS